MTMPSRFAGHFFAQREALEVKGTQVSGWCGDQDLCENKVSVSDVQELKGDSSGRAEKPRA